jgi:hypothetical protein
MARVVVWLPSKREALSSNPSTAKKKKSTTILRFEFDIICPYTCYSSTNNFKLND